jgi:hypothetical protein
MPAQDSGRRFTSQLDHEREKYAPGPGQRKGFAGTTEYSIVVCADTPYLKTLGALLSIASFDDAFWR